MILISFPSSCHNCFSTLSLLLLLFKQVRIQCDFPMAVMRLMSISESNFHPSSRHLRFLLCSSFSQSAESSFLFSNRPKEMALGFEPLTSRSNTWWIRPQDHGVLLRERLLGLTNQLTFALNPKILNSRWSLWHNENTLDLKCNVNKSLISLDP